MGDQPVTIVRHVTSPETRARFNASTYRCRVHHDYTYQTVDGATVGGGGSIEIGLDHWPPSEQAAAETYDAVVQFLIAQGAATGRPVDPGSIQVTLRRNEPLDT